jgi:alkaline phosphatase D
MEIMQEKWKLLDQQPGFARLRKACQVLATWDDHDYGLNDGGVEFTAKAASQKVFLDFFNEPADSPRRQREGIYDAKLFGEAERRVQIILLDTRYFRSQLVKSGKTYSFGSGIHGPYAANDDPNTTVLGEAQWEWLEQQLRVPARLRIIASSIQVISNEHWWEKWGNFPHERQRLFQLLKETKAGGAVLISGDRHRAEVSRIDCGLGYPLYDITSSSLNQPQPWRNELNEHRVGTLFGDINFGTITIDWTQADPLVTMEIRDSQAKSMIEVQHHLSELQP